MTETARRKPWTYVGHKDGYWAVLLSGDLANVRRKLADLLAEGLTVTPTYDRAEFEALLGTMKPWTQRPA